MKIFVAKKHFWINETQMVLKGQMFMVQSIGELPPPASNPESKSMYEFYAEVESSVVF